MNHIKYVLLPRYQRFAAGLATHPTLIPTELASLMHLPALTAAGEAFVAEIAREEAVLPTLRPLELAAATAELELKIAYNRLKNYVEAEVGERSPELTALFTAGNLETKAVHLLTACGTHAALAVRLPADAIATLQREVAEHRATQADLTAAEGVQVAADHATDDLVPPLAQLLHIAQAYLRTYLEDSKQLALLLDFVAPRVVAAKAAAPVAPVA